MSLDAKVIENRCAGARPKVLLLGPLADANAASQTLEWAGFEVAVGGFGRPYRVEKNDGYAPVISNGEIPLDCAEADVVVVDLAPEDILPAPIGEKHVSNGADDWWASCQSGLVDPRPRLMFEHRQEFDKVCASGGVFLVFAGAKVQQDLVCGTSWTVNRERGAAAIPADGWSFLTVLGYLKVVRDFGKKIAVCSGQSARLLSLSRLLGRHIAQGGATFLCTIDPDRELSGEWTRLAENRYGNAVAGVLTLGQGQVIILPHLKDKVGFLSELLTDVLPDLSPHLFPNIEKAGWTSRPEYELPQVLVVKSKIEQLNREFDGRKARLESSIEEIRDELGYQHDLITGTGDKLVKAVEQALNIIGFRAIVNIDEENAARGSSEEKREDLQIRDVSPLALVEVKGISGSQVKEADSIQVWKYVAPRMRELQRTDIHGLSIINQQRHLPPLERNNSSLFSEDVLVNAEDQGFGLMTTWDLFRLVRSYLKNGWAHDAVRPLFYANGRVSPVPAHYQLIGVVREKWPKVGAVGVSVDSGSIRVGDRVAFELPVEYEEQEVISLQVEKQAVDEVGPGTLAGIQAGLLSSLSKGARVYRVGCLPVSSQPAGR